MKIVASILFFVLLQLSVLANGKSSLFEHLDEGWRTIDGEGRFRISGHRDSIILRFNGPELNWFSDWSGGEILFPKKRSILIDVNGKNFQMKIEQSKGIENMWVASIVNGQQLTKGEYSLVLVISIDGTERIYDHRFRYSFDNINLLTSETKNRYVR